MLWLIFFWSFLLSYFVIPFVIYMSHTKEILDVPGSRAIHDKLTPRLGGIGIFIGLLGAMFLFGVWDSTIQAAFGAALLLFLIGLKDDLVGVPVSQKLVVQLVAAGFLVFLTDMHIDNLYGLFGLGALPYWLSVGLSFVFIIGLTNSLNLIDGVDGLAGTLMVFYCLVFGFSFVAAGDPMAWLCFALAGGLVAFLRYNLISSTVFMGDSGSLVSGLMLCLFVIRFIHLRDDSYGAMEAFCICIVPILDTLRVMVIRLSQGRSPFSPDRLHLHHRLLALGLRHWQVVAVLLLISGLGYAFTFSFIHFDAPVLLGLVIFLAILINFAIELAYRLWGKAE